MFLPKFHFVKWCAYEGLTLDLPRSLQFLGRLLGSEVHNTCTYANVKCEFHNYYSEIYKIDMIIFGPMRLKHFLLAKLVLGV